MANGFPHPVDSLRILAMNRLQTSTHAVRTRRDDDQVDMVGHQAVSENTQAFAAPIGMEQIQIGLWVPGSVKNVFTMIAALGDVMRHTRKYRSTVSRHASKLVAALRQVARCCCAFERKWEK
jgi:hypothetical protein